MRPQQAIFRANLAVVNGFERYAGARTTVRIINPVESHTKARSKSTSKTAPHGAGVAAAAEIIIKNQDPPAIRSPSRE